MKEPVHHYRKARPTFLKISLFCRLLGREQLPWPMRQNTNEDLHSVLLLVFLIYSSLQLFVPLVTGNRYGAGYRK